MSSGHDHIVILKLWGLTNILMYYQSVISHKHNGMVSPLYQNLLDKKGDISKSTGYPETRIDEE